MPPSDAGLVSLRDVTVSFRRDGAEPFVVFESMSLQIARHETVALLGPSGVGKTTLLKLMGGLVAPTAGVVAVKGESPAAARRNRRLDFVFQQPVLLPWLNTLQNVEFAGRIQGDRAVARRAREALDLVGLRGFETVFPHQLSGGMQARAALARALTCHPELLLLDEPFGALDAFTRSVLQDELLRVVQMAPLTIALVTHSVEEAVYLADRVVLLGGRPARIRADLRFGLPRPRTRSTRRLREFHDAVDRLEEQVFLQAETFPGVGTSRTGGV